MMKVFISQNPFQVICMSSMALVSLRKMARAPNDQFWSNCDWKPRITSSW